MKVSKKSGKPFKSGLKINTVRETIIHPKTGKDAYTFLEDDSYVECRQTMSVCDNKFACEECFPGIKEIGQIVPGYWLVFYNEAYCILGGQGHIGDIVFTFKNTPYKYPEYKGNNFISCSMWADNILQDIETLRLDIMSSYELARSVMEQGFNGRNIYYWLANKCGELVNENNCNSR